MTRQIRLQSMAGWHFHLRGWAVLYLAILIGLTGDFSQASGLTAVYRDPRGSSWGSSSVASNDLPGLTGRGKSVRVVAVAAMLGGVCSGDDWRADLPRYISRFLPKAEVVVFNSRSVDPPDDTCHFCEYRSRSGSSSSIRSGGPSFSCKQWWAGGSVPGGRAALQSGKTPRKADVLLIIGTGTTKCPTKHLRQDGSCEYEAENPLRFQSLNQLNSSPWITNDTLVVHFPVRRLQPLMENHFSYDYVIEDDSFAKPLGDDSSRLMGGCDKFEKRNDLLYVGRYDMKSGVKGQSEFLQRVDPQLLQGYRIQFYGANWSRGMADKLYTLASLRNISVAVSGPVPKQQLLAHLCVAKGHIHYAMNDDNPRAPYEALYAGNPVFASFSSHLAAPLYREEFVFGSDYHAPAPVMNKDFAAFMAYVRHSAGRSERKRIRRYAKSQMSAMAVYSDLCRRMKLCSREGEEQSRPRASDASAVVRKGSMQLRDLFRLQ